MKNLLFVAMLLLGATAFGQGSQTVTKPMPAKAPNHDLMIQESSVSQAAPMPAQQLPATKTPHETTRTSRFGISPKEVSAPTIFSPTNMCSWLKLTTSMEITPLCNLPPIKLTTAESARRGSRSIKKNHKRLMNPSLV